MFSLCLAPGVCACVSETNIDGDVSDITKQSKLCVQCVAAPLSFLVVCEYVNKQVNVLSVEVPLCIFLLYLFLAGRVKCGCRKTLEVSNSGRPKAAV